MSSSDEARWLQRLETFGTALPSLTDACRQSHYTDLERAGLVQTFESTFELAWKTLKDLLFYEGYDERTPRAIIRRGFEAGYLEEEDCEILLDALAKRNMLAHIYRKALAQEAETLIKQRYQPALLRLHETLTAKGKE